MPHAYGGLTGKARKVHQRERASRWCIDQMIAEYVDPDDDGLRRDRFIPIRARSEFLPSAGFAMLTDEETTGGQLELPLADRKQQPPLRSGDQGEEDTLCREGSQAAASGKPAEVSALKVVGVDATTEPFPQPVKRHRSMSRIPLEWFQDKTSARKRRPFSWKRFAVGCAMGSAAAALFLVVAYITFG